MSDRYDCGRGQGKVRQRACYGEAFEMGARHEPLGSRARGGDSVPSTRTAGNRLRGFRAMPPSCPSGSRW